MEVRDVPSIDASAEPQVRRPACPKCDEAWTPLPSVGVACLEGTKLRRCPRCGTRSAGGAPSRLLYNCEGCGRPFLDETILPHGSQRCPKCQGGRLPLATPEPEVSAAAEQEVRAGLDQSWRFVSTPALSAYVNRLVREIASRMEGAPDGCRVFLVDEEAVRTVALPSGAILMSLGMLRLIRDEAELIFVLGHELAHVAYSGAAVRLMRSGFDAVARGRVEDETAAWTEAVLDLIRLGYGRRRERDADLRALEVMLDLRYDPESALRFLRRVDSRIEEGDPRMAELSLAHPPPSYRVRKLEGALYGRSTAAGVFRVNREVFRRAVGETALVGPFTMERIVEAGTGEATLTSWLTGRRAWVLMGVLAAIVLLVALGIVLSG